MVVARPLLPVAPVDATFDEAAAVYRGALTCWLPTALPGELSDSWRTRVRGGLVPVTLECRATPPFGRPGEVSRHVRVRALPSGGGNGATARFVSRFDGDLILRADADGGASLVLRLRTDARPAWRARATARVARAFVGAVAGQLSTAPPPPPDLRGGTVRTVVPCPVTRA